MANNQALRVSGILLFIILLFPTCANAQAMTRPLDSLINTAEPGWALVTKWMDSATNPVEILPVDSNRAKKALYELQVTSRSPMGAIVLNTGGLLIDHGWIRVMGSGSNRLNRELMRWNRDLYQSQNPGFIVVADDIIGGFFILNGGGLGDDIGKVYYLSPDNLEFEPMQLTYTEFLFFCFNANLEQFYQGYRWKSWKADAKALAGTQVYNFYPPLFSKEAKDIEKVSRKPVPLIEQFFLHLDFRKQLGLEKTDTIGHE